MIVLCLIRDNVAFRKQCLFFVCALEVIKLGSHKCQFSSLNSLPVLIVIEFVKF